MGLIFSSSWSQRMCTQSCKQPYLLWICKTLPSHFQHIAFKFKQISQIAAVLAHLCVNENSCIVWGRNYTTLCIVGSTKYNAVNVSSYQRQETEGCKLSSRPVPLFAQHPPASAGKPTWGWVGGYTRHIQWHRGVNRYKPILMDIFNFQRQIRFWTRFANLNLKGWKV